jgi:polysaccharide biosynthesis protein PslJ
MTLLAGILVGGSAAVLGLMIAFGTPILAFGAVIGIGVGLYVITNLMAGLYITLAAVALMPFATLPVRIALTPTFIDVALGGFLLVYVFQWMTRRRSDLRATPAHPIILTFMVFTLFSFVAGLGHAALTTNVLRKFAELLLSIGTALVLVDVVRDVATARRVALALIVVGAAQAILGIGLYALNDTAAERLLNALGRFGYPVGGVIRYVEDTPELGERAIGTWVDPNAYGGFLLMCAALAGVQILSRNPVTGRRWIAVALFAPIAVALLLTQSRGAWLALGVAILFVGLVRYRWILVAGAITAMVGGGAVLIVPPIREIVEPYANRLIAGLTGEDLATQMRFGEYKDALILIGRYPLIGVGFAGAPDRDIYLGVSSMYLKIAGGTGLVGLTLFLLTILETFRYGFAQWRKQSALLSDVWLGFAAGLIGAMVSGVVDHYYFNIEFHGAVTMFWCFVGLSLATARIAYANVAKASTDTEKSLIKTVKNPSRGAFAENKILL